MAGSMLAPVTTRAAPDARSLRNQWEDDFLDGEIDAEDFIASALGRPQGGGRATPAYIGIEAYKIDRVATSSEFGALVVLELPLERFARSAAPLAAVAWWPDAPTSAAPLATIAWWPEAPASAAPPPLFGDSAPSELSSRGSSALSSPPALPRGSSALAPSVPATSRASGGVSPYSASPLVPGSLAQSAPVRAEPTARPAESAVRAEPAPRPVESVVRAEPTPRPTETAVRGESAVRGPRSSAPLAVSTNVARACIRAALRMVGLSDDNRLDSVAARSRSSAVLPELRLRALRTMGESGRVSLSEDDPSRYVASGAATNVLEARLTFRLDRLLFADEELAVERVRVDRSELRSRTTAKALAALFEWQRAYCLANDPGLAPDDHLTAVLRELEACAILDAMTGGWFGSYRAELPPPAR